MAEVDDVAEATRLHGVFLAQRTSLQRKLDALNFVATKLSAGAGATQNTARIASLTSVIDELDIDIENLEAGISSGGGGGGGGGGGDQVPPSLVGSPVVTPTSTGAVISFNTSEPATSRYGVGTGANPTINLPAEVTLKTAHSIVIIGKAASTVYKYRLELTDQAGNVTTDTADRTFTTTAAPVVAVQDRIGINMGRPSADGFHDGTLVEYFNGVTGSSVKWIGVWSRQANWFSSAEMATVVAETLDVIHQAKTMSKFVSHAEWVPVLTLGFIPIGGTPAQVTGGSFNTHIDAVANKYVSEGYTGNVWIRLHHEFSGGPASAPWYPWFCGDNPTDQQAWRTANRFIIDRMRAIGVAHSINFKFIQCSATDASIEWYTNAYWGDAYADAIGVDQYDTNAWIAKTGTGPYHTWQNPAQAWAIVSQAANAILSVQAFAHSRSKPFCVPEFGCWSDLRSGLAAVGGGDNGYFLDRIGEITAGDATCMAMQLFRDPIPGLVNHDVLYDTVNYPVASTRVAPNF